MYTTATLSPSVPVLIWSTAIDLINFWISIDRITEDCGRLAKDTYVITDFPPPASSWLSKWAMRFKPNLPGRDTYAFHNTKELSFPRPWIIVGIRRCTARIGQYPRGVLKRCPFQPWLNLQNDQEYMLVHLYSVHVVTTGNFQNFGDSIFSLSHPMFV